MKICKRVGKKGFEPISIIIGIVVFTFFLAITAIPFLFLKVRITGTVNAVYVEDKATLGLLTLLSDRATYKEVSLYSAGLQSLSGKFDRSSAEALMKNELDKIVESGCYSLSNSTADLVSTSCTPQKSGYAIILLPNTPDSLDLKIS